MKLATMNLTSSHASIAVVIIRIFGVVCQAAIFVVVVNHLTAHDVGIFSVLYVFWGLIRMLGPMGLDHIILRDVAGAIAQGDTPQARALCRHGSLDVAVVSGLLALATGLVLLVINTLTGHPFSETDILLVAAAVPAFSLIGVLASALRGFGYNISSQAIESIGLHLLTLGFIFAVVLQADLSLAGVLACMAAGAWITTFVYVAMLLRHAAGPTAVTTAEARRSTRGQAFEVWQALLLIGLAGRAPNYVSLVLLGPVPTAILEVALRFGTLPTIFTSGVSVTFSPIFAGHHVRNERDAFCQALAVGSWLAFVPSAVILLVTLFFGQWLLELFFPPIYQEAYIPLLVIVASTAINAAFGLSSPILLMTGRQRLVRVYSVIRIVAVIVSGVVLGLWLGVTGIALSFLIGFAVFDIGLAKQIRPQLNVTGFLRPQGLSMLFRTLRHAG